MVKVFLSFDNTVTKPVRATASMIFTVSTMSQDIIYRLK